jgi:hypothetical protein
MRYENIRQRFCLYIHPSLQQASPGVWLVYLLSMGSDMSQPDDYDPVTPCDSYCGYHVLKWKYRCVYTETDDYGRVKSSSLTIGVHTYYAEARFGPVPNGNVYLQLQSIL